MACCCFWFIHPASGMTKNRKGFKMCFASAQLIISLPEFTAHTALRSGGFNQIEFSTQRGRKSQRSRRHTSNIPTGNTSWIASSKGTVGTVRTITRRWTWSLCMWNRSRCWALASFVQPSAFVTPSKKFSSTFDPAANRRKLSHWPSADGNFCSERSHWNRCSWLRYRSRMRISSDV
jgi:hypothetical protein